MNIEDLKKLSEKDALQAAAKFTGVDASVLDGMWRAESARGTAMVSPAGARGHFGLMPKTQELFEKKLGVKINPNNFHESLFLAAHHLQEDLKREGGNVVAALRAYNNGPNWRNQRDPRGENAAYASRVLGTEEVKAVVPVKPNDQPMPANSSTPMPFGQDGEVKDTSPKLQTALASASFVAGSLVDTPQINIGAAFQAGAAADLKRQEEIDGLGFLDAARASFMHQGIMGNTLKRIERPEFAPVAGYVPPEQELAGRSQNDQSFLLEARSPEEFNQLKWELDVEQEDMRRMSLRGPGFAVAAGIFSGLPEGFVSGIAAGKVLATAGLGAKAAMEAGNAGRAIGMSALENVGGNLVTTAIEDAISGRMSAMDYAVAGSIGLPFTGLAIPGLIKGAAIANQNKMAFRIAADAAAKQAALAEQAAKNLGDGATAEAIAKEIERLEVAEVKTTLGPDSLGEDRRLIPDVDKIEADETAADLKARSTPGPEKQMLPGATAPSDISKLVDESGKAVVLRETTGLDLLINISLSTGDNYVKQLASRLMTAIGENPVKVYIVDEKNLPLVSNSGATRSHYSPTRHAVFLTEEDASNPRQRWVVTHEMAHAASLFRLRTARSIPDSAIGKVAKDIGALRKELAISWKASGKRDQHIEYYLSNDDEFLAGLYSGRNTFTDFLKSTKVADTKTAWNGFVDLIRRLLNIPENEMEAFTKALNLSEQLLSTPLTTKVGFKEGGAMVVAQAPLTPPQQVVADKFGLGLLPVGTPAQRAEQKALVAIYAKADDPAAPWNNIDPKWLNTLTAKSHSLGSTGLQMLRSKNPVARMVAAELLESTTGAGGRRATASIAKYMAERKYMGNTINGFQDAYKVWRNAQGGGIWEDYVGGTHWEAFNRKVAEEIEGRRTSTPTASAPAVKQAADILEAAYERMRVDQIAKKTTGWGGLPESSKGYMPHRLSGERVRNMTIAQHNAFHSALVDQFVSIEGWDISFSSNLAAKYIDRAKIRAMGGHDIPANVHHTGAGEVVRDALQAMGMAPDEIRAQMEKFMRGGASHTKARLKLNLLQTFEDNGKTFTLMDLFETDQFTLLRGQAGRVSGEVALAKHGIMGRPGMQLLRRAIADFGADAGKSQPHEVEAFDQVAAEFLNEPFGDYGGKWMNRAMQVNSLARLGGMGFTQFAEYINIATHLGVLRALSVLSGTKRLHAEAKALARGEAVNNPILGSIEVFGGAEFGSDAYKMVFPFDNPSLQYQVNGHDTITLADRLLRGGIHAQGKLSAWRAIHSAQQRGVAEQIVHKAVKFIRDGGNDKALADMGIDANLAQQLKADLGRIAKFDSAGNLVQFDITKTENLKAAEAFVQAVHRGTGQIIQGTFIGETGKWAHSGWLRLLTQFRTFSITSVEKQWARNRNNHGVGQAALMLMGSMSVAWPIYVARQYSNSIGREDREAYLEKQLQPEKIARATLNYVASSGLAGDFLDAFASVTGLTEATGGRAGSTTEFVGTVIAPAAGLADDLWRGIQNSKEGTDVHEVVKNLPFAKLPWLAPAINLMGN